MPNNFNGFLKLLANQNCLDELGVAVRSLEKFERIEIF